MNEALIKRLMDARYKILVACRPLAPAKYAFNVTLQAIIDDVHTDLKTAAAIEALKLLE